MCDDKPVNVFLDICELPGQDAQSICDCIVNTLAKYSFDKEYLVKNLIAFTCDGASVLLGVKSGVGKRLKDQFPALVIWHCMNHRLELAVSDAIKSINGFYTLASFFNKIYSTYSFSAKMQRELKEIASKLDVELRKIGKVFTIRWAASTYRAVYALSPGQTMPTFIPTNANIVGHCWALLDVGWPNEPNINTQHLSAYHSNACSYLRPRLLNFQIV